MRIQAIIIRLRKTANHAIALSAAAILLAAAAPVFAHNGVEHVGGTVAKVSGHVVTIKTSTGNVDVMMGDKTALTKGGQKAQMSDLTPGTRVQADVPEEGKDKTAHAVKILTTGAAAHDEHGADHGQDHDHDHK